MLWLIEPVESVQAKDAIRLSNIETVDDEAYTTIYLQNLEESLFILGESGSGKISGKTANFIENGMFEDTTENVISEITNRLKEDPFGKLVIIVLLKIWLQQSGMIEVRLYQVNMG